MTIKITCDIECRMTKPLLNSLHRNIVCKQKAGTAVTEIMETEHFQTVLLDDLMEVVRYCIGADELSIRITADYVC
jgi:hypothetical protein